MFQPKAQGYGMFVSEVVDMNRYAVTVTALDGNMPFSATDTCTITVFADSETIAFDKLDALFGSGKRAYDACLIIEGDLA